jgi:Chain length determinant protein
MQENKSAYYSLKEVMLQTKLFVNFLMQKKFGIITSILIGAGIGAGYYFIQKPKYEAVSTFILEEKSTGGGLAGLASQFGFNLGSLGSGGNLFAGDNILTILKSKTVVEKVLLSRVDEVGKDSTRLVDLFLDFSGRKKRWRKKPVLSGISFANVNHQLTPIQDSVLNLIYDEITKKLLFTDRTSKQGSIIKVQVNAQNSTFARLMVDRIVIEAANLYLDIKTGTADANIRQMQRRSDSLLLLLNRKSYSAAATQTIDVNPALRTLVVPVEIANRDKTVLATLYSEVTKNLEASKLILSQQTPVIQLLDRPGVLLDDNKKGMVILIIAFSFVSTLLFVLYHLMLYIFNFSSTDGG